MEKEAKSQVLEQEDLEIEEELELHEEEINLINNIVKEQLNENEFSSSSQLEKEAKSQVLEQEDLEIEEELELHEEEINLINNIVKEQLNENKFSSSSQLENEAKSQVLEQKDLEIELRNFQQNLIEGALYAAGRPLDIEELSTKLEISKQDTEDLVNKLAFEYLERSSALIIAQVGEKYQMQLRPEYTERVSKFAKGGAISEANLRTLTIIALKQPILKSTVVKIRGSGAYEHVKYLLDNELISATKKGRTHELTTTDKYADMFGLPKNKEELKRAMISQLGLEDMQE